MASGGAVNFAILKLGAGTLIKRSFDWSPGGKGKMPPEPELADVRPFS
jgi:hypothetical protein